MSDRKSKLFSLRNRQTAPKDDQPNKTRNLHPTLIFLITIIVGAVAILSVIYGREKVLAAVSAVSIPLLLLWLVHAYTRNDLGSVKLSIVWGVLGAAMLIFGIYGDPTYLNANILSVIVNLASTLLSLAVIGVILQLKDTKEYFASTLSDLIMRESYVEKLNRSQLEKLQKTILERYFENSSDFNRENSFYKFFSKNLQSYIGSPYRENYRNTISIEETVPRSAGCVVTDELNYQLRAMGKDIQKLIVWKAARDEIQTLKTFSVWIDNVQIFSWPPDQEQDSASENIAHDFSSNPQDGIELTIDLEKMSQTRKDIKDVYVDGAHVRISTRYLATNYKSITAKLLFPTKGFLVNVFHPSNMRCKVEPYGFDSQANTCEYNQTKQGFAFSYQDWVLPYSGLYIAIEAIDIVGEKREKEGSEEKIPSPIVPSESEDIAQGA
ncbi:hypothetical protein [Herbaspirillum huttiense]|uniref:hypothetical protein n=1 Tax=Herbaspirillum huttiense TaxID=863372 RepID=UPI0031DE5706